MDDNKVRSFRPSEEYQILESINQVQFVTISNLQKQNQELQDKIKHLEQLLFSRAILLNEGQ